MGNNPIEIVESTVCHIISSHPLKDNGHGAHVKLPGGVGLTTTCGGCNVGRRELIHPCKAVRILDCRGSDTSKFCAIGEVVGRTELVGGKVRHTTIQKLEKLIHYEENKDGSPAYSVAEGWGFSPFVKHKNAPGTLARGGHFTQMPVPILQAKKFQ